MIVLPSAVPSIFTGLREGLANGWQTLVAVELIASFEGLRYLMAYGRQLFQLELVFSAMIVVGLSGLVIHGLLRLPKTICNAGVRRPHDQPDHDCRSG
ncbi:ABC transporter permease subunit [Mesorhizobium sp. M0815]